MKRDLEGKVCLVTGTSRGIGKAIVECYAEKGAVVYANARQNGSIDEWTIKLREKYKTLIIPVYYDVTDSGCVKYVIEQIKREQGKLDVLVNNAGITSNELLGMIKKETLNRLYDTNVFAYIYHMQYACRLMQRQKSGAIINISSIIGVEGNRGEIAYSGTKGAVISITKSAAKELASDGIRVNSVAPGMTETDMFMNAAKTKENVEKHIANIGFGRLAKPEDIANACAFFASDASSYITGQVLGVNGAIIM